eukprot:GEMP01097558.1.p1 GENE.GEMP01097558.1~~GEMP01097558.1.p1  ORF type:complete len:112 (-),score=3.62 GEMP01097558.1:306-641(-)
MMRRAEHSALLSLVGDDPDLVLLPGVFFHIAVVRKLGCGISLSFIPDIFCKLLIPGSTAHSSPFGCRICSSVVPNFFSFGLLLSDSDACSSPLGSSTSSLSCGLVLLGGTA